MEQVNPAVPLVKAMECPSESQNTLDMLGLVMTCGCSSPEISWYQSWFIRKWSSYCDGRFKSVRSRATKIASCLPEQVQRCGYVTRLAFSGMCVRRGWCLPAQHDGSPKVAGHIMAARPLALVASIMQELGGPANVKQDCIISLWR